MSEGVEERELHEEPEEEVTQVEESSVNPNECPVCHTVVPYFLLTHKRAPAVKCPNCGSVIWRNKLPKGYTYRIVSRTIYNKSGSIPMDDLLREVEEKEALEAKGPEEKIEEASAQARNIREELFPRPKEPCQVLYEILESYGLNKTFIDWMTRRCQRVGYLHPLELYHYMRTMRSGIKTEQEAAFIAEEYAQALQAELQKAQRMGMEYPLPSLTIPPQKIGGEPAVVSRLMNLVPPQGQTTQAGPTTSPPYQYGRPSQTTMPYQHPSQPMVVSTGREVLEAFKVSTQIAQQQMQTQMQTMSQLIDAKINQSITPIAQALNQLSQALQNLGKPQQTMSPEVLKTLIESKEKVAKAEAEKEYMKALFELQTRQYEQLIKSYEKDREELVAVNKELQKKLEEYAIKASRPVGEFRSDEAKLIAESIRTLADVGHKFVDVLANKRPVEVVMKFLPHIMKEETKKAKVEKAKTSESLIEELEKEGLVEEE